MPRLTERASLPASGAEPTAGVSHRPGRDANAAAPRRAAPPGKATGTSDDGRRAEVPRDADRPSAPRDAHAAEPPAGAVEGLRIVRLLLEAPDFRHAATALCTRLALDLGAARVCAGWIRRDRAQLIAQSGAAIDALDEEDARRLQAAMDESLDQGLACWSPDPDATRRIAHAQQRLRRVHGGAALSVPLVHAGRRLGALTLEFESSRATTAELARRCEALAALAAPVLETLHARDEAGWLDRLRGGVARGERARVRRTRLRSVAVAATLLLAALALVPIDMEVSAQARVEGEVQRVVAAPTNGYLKAVRVRPGDAVRAGDVLAELGARDLELERDKLASELAQHRSGADAAFARGDRGAMAIAQAKADEARAQLDLVGQQLARSVLVAPIDGVLIQGDLWQSLNAPVERGQTLFTLAPADRWRVIVELDERDLAQATVGQRGRLALSALPWDALPLEVTRIAPMASTREERNVFELEARLSGAPPDLRPGLRGIARLDAPRRTLLALWSERLGAVLHRLAWRWLP